MVEDALMDIFKSVAEVCGGDMARADFVTSLCTLGQEGVFVGADMLYDEPMSGPRKMSVSHIPESVAAARHPYCGVERGNSLNEFLVYGNDQLLHPAELLKHLEG